MKKALLICGAMLALTAGAASAGINLSFGDCGAAGTNSAPLTCTNNGGAQLLLVISATLSAPLGQALTQETVIDCASSAAAISPWWDFRATGCRPTSMSSPFSFGTLSNCTDPWSGQALGGYDYGVAPIPDATNGNLPNHSRIRTVCALPAPSPVSLDAGTEYYICEVLINKAKTVGLGGCAGCLDDMTFYLNSVKISQPDGADGGNPTLTSPDNGACVRSRSGPNAAQCNATPNTNRTWGSVKALYR